MPTFSTSGLAFKASMACLISEDSSFTDTAAMYYTPIPFKRCSCRRMVKSNRCSADSTNTPPSTALSCFSFIITCFASAANRIVWYLFAFIEIVLAFRFVLKLLGANPDAGFTKFVYSLSTPFAGPFLNIFRASTNAGAETTSYFEWSTLVAAIVYIVLTWAIIKLFKLGKPTDPNEVAQSVNNQ
jgi:hypothetical protein